MGFGFEEGEENGGGRRDKRRGMGDLGEGAVDLEELVARLARYLARLRSRITIPYCSRMD